MKIVPEVPNEDGLVRRMISGDEEAFTHLYRRLHPPIFRFALHMSGNSGIAEDVTQEVFMTLIRNAKEFDASRGTLSAFLFGVARNQVRKRWERDRRLVSIEEEREDEKSGKARETLYENMSADVTAYRNGSGNAANLSGFDRFASQETVARVRGAVSSLPENYREVVILCELEEMSYEEAAEALDCPVGTVRSRLHRARAILLEKLREPETARRASAVGE